MENKIFIDLPPLTEVRPTLSKPKLPLTPLILYVDGACQPNPGNMFIGLALVHQCETVWTHHSFAGEGTNNQAEFKAILQGILLLEKIPTTYPEFNIPCTIVSDSRITVDTFQIKRPPKSPELLEIYNRIMEAFQRLTIKPEFHWVPRTLNSAADNLSKSSLFLRNINN